MENLKPRIAVAVPEAQAWVKYKNYFETLAALGAEPVATGADVDPAAFDGLLLPGGVDVNPMCYHCRNTACELIDDALDELQLGALDAFVKAGKPVFGICRGHQLIDVYFGGTLIQHLPQAVDHCRCGLPEDKVHASRAEPGSIVYALYGGKFAVNSSHHQGVDKPGEGLRLTQWSGDGVAEAMEHATLPIFSVQWHPERMCLERSRSDTVDGAKVIEYFIQMCRAEASR